MVLAALVVAIDALVLFAVPEASAPRRVQVDLVPLTFLQRHLGLARFFTLGPLQPNYGSYFGIASLNVNDIPIPTAFRTYVHERLDQVVDPKVFVGDLGGGRSPRAPSPEDELQRNLAGYRAAGVKYVLSPAGRVLPERPATFRLVLRTPSTWIYRLSGSASYFSSSERGCAVLARTRTSVRLSCPRQALLIRRETHLPGWSARIDGRRARIHSVDGLFQGVTVPEGSHQVTFSYSPPYVNWGFLAFAAGSGWLLLTPFAGHRRFRRLFGRTAG
jgi:hypothetical protein